MYTEDALKLSSLGGTQQPIILSTAKTQEMPQDNNRSLHLIVCALIHQSSDLTLLHGSTTKEPVMSLLLLEWSELLMLGNLQNIKMLSSPGEVYKTSLK